MSEGMLEKLDLEDEGKPFKSEPYLVVLVVFNRASSEMSSRVLSACHVAWVLIYFCLSA